MREPYINNLIDNNVNDVFIQMQYNTFVNDNEIIYKKYEYSYEEFKIMIQNLSKSPAPGPPGKM